MHSLNITRCIKHGVKLYKVHQVQRKHIIDNHKVCSKWHRHEHKLASAFVIGQLCHQSATDPSRATHAVDAVAVHRCQKLWSHTHVAK